MGVFAFHYGPRLLAGEGVVSRVGELCPPGPVLIVTNRALVALGLVNPVIERLGKKGHSVVVFDAVEADPSRDTLEKAVAKGRAAGGASVIGFGGGSPMDVAKLVAYLIGSDDDLDAIWGVDKAVGNRLPLLLIPTTAGTGSEATPVAIMTLPGDEKRGVSSWVLVPDHAVLDPTLTVGLPRDVTAATGLDAIVHAIEAYTSLHLKNPLSDLLAREALRLLAGNLLTACEIPDDLAARSAMLLGAHLAGVAFANAPVAGVHALAYPLGARFHVPHGLSNELMLPHVISFNLSAATSFYAELGPIIDPALAGLGEQAQAAGVVEGLRRLSVDVGIAAADLQQLATDAMLQERLLRNNPRPIYREDAERLYEAAL